MLDAVLVAGDEAAADPAVEVLAPVVEQVEPPYSRSWTCFTIEPFVVAEPDRLGEHQDVGAFTVSKISGQSSVATQRQAR